MTDQVPKTIFMRKADWEKWKARLLDPKSKQAHRELANNNGGFCCLGHLQMSIESKIKSLTGQLPSHDWLRTNGIRFHAGYSLNPILPTLNCSAAQANDNGYTLPQIAEAIEQCIEFTDEVVA